VVFSDVIIAGNSNRPGLIVQIARQQSCAVDVAFGSKPVLRRCPRRVCFAPGSGHRATELPGGSARPIRIWRRVFRNRVCQLRMGIDPARHAGAPSVSGPSQYPEYDALTALALGRFAGVLAGLVRALSVWTIRGECGGNLPRPLTAPMHSGYIDPDLAGCRGMGTRSGPRSHETRAAPILQHP
jgi:hypothetical protein